MVQLSNLLCQCRRKEITNEDVGNGGTVVFGGHVKSVLFMFKLMVRLYSQNCTFNRTVFLVV